MKRLYIVLYFMVLFGIISCSQKLNGSGNDINTNNDVELLSFSCEKSFEHFLDLDSILNEIPDTMGFKLTATGDSVDWRLNTALGIQWGEWGKYFKNPTITSVKQKRKSSVITVEFTASGGYDFDGKAESSADTLYLHYSIVGDNADERSKDTRYILIYEFRSKIIEGKEMIVEYKD